MSVKIMFEYTLFFETGLCLAVLIAMWRRGAIQNFKMLFVYLAFVVAANSITIPIMFFYPQMGLTKLTAYRIYYYETWATYLIRAALLIGVLYGVFHFAMRPLKGLDNIGKIVFRWVAGVALVVSFALGLGPQISGPGGIDIAAWVAASMHIQQGISILTLCLLLFVCFTIKPLGLTYGSRIFGVSVGLGIGATVQLLESAWVSLHEVQSVYDPIYLFNILGATVGYAVWLVYFSKPEPARRLILLPTTSPYFFWNAVSEALGDEPGNVAVGGVAPSLFGAAELEVLIGQARINTNADPAKTGSVSNPAVRSRRTPRQFATFS